jgi:hypothetical protein
MAQTHVIKIEMMAQAAFGDYSGGGFENFAVAKLMTD